MHGRSNKSMLLLMHIKQNGYHRRYLFINVIADENYKPGTIFFLTHWFRGFSDWDVWRAIRGGNAEFFWTLGVCHSDVG